MWWGDNPEIRDAVIDAIDAATYDNHDGSSGVDPYGVMEELHDKGFRIVKRDQ